MGWRHKIQSLDLGTIANSNLIFDRRCCIFSCRFTLRRGHATGQRRSPFLVAAARGSQFLNRAPSPIAALCYCSSVPSQFVQVSLCFFSSHFFFLFKRFVMSHFFFPMCYSNSFSLVIDLDEC